MVIPAARVEQWWEGFSDPYTAPEMHRRSGKKNCGALWRLWGIELAPHILESSITHHVIVSSNIQLQIQVYNQLHRSGIPLILQAVSIVTRYVIIATQPVIQYIHIDLTSKLYSSVL